nr:MAG TPA: hypothetical protein [Caudoviricetes sp.]
MLSSRMHYLERQLASNTCIVWCKNYPRVNTVPK